MLISFSGIDGCGKTTFALEVVEFLKTRGLKARCLRVADLAISRRIGNLLSKASGKSAQRAASSSGAVFAFFRKATLFFDVLLFWVVHLHAKASRTTLVCDRYFFDLIVHLNYLGISTNLFEKVLLTVAPTPDIAFLMIVPAEVAVTRDLDFSPDFYEKKQLHYMRLFERIRAVKIESKSLDSTSKQVQKEVVAHLGQNK